MTVAPQIPLLLVPKQEPIVYGKPSLTDLSSPFPLLSYRLNLLTAGNRLHPGISSFSTLSLPSTTTSILSLNRSWVTSLPSSLTTLRNPLHGEGGVPSLSSPVGIQVRGKKYGSEYQPSNLKRKRRHGFLARKRSLGGRKILKRRAMKGRWVLTH